MRVAIILMIAACNKEPSPPRADDGSSHLQAPVIVVTKSEVRCDVVIDKLRRAVASYDATIGALVATKAPMVLGSCLFDDWPLELKACIVASTPEELVAHHCDEHVPDELAQKLIDRLAPGQRLSPRDFLRR